jgi:cold shock CspA family protein
LALSPDQGGKDIFVHASALERAGIMGLAEGQCVAIDVAQGQKGPEAVGLRVTEAPGALLSGELRWKTDLRHCCPSD